MAFIGIEFAADVSAGSGAIALVHHTWFTPLKNEVWWPPYKTSARFKKALSFGEEPKEETWKLCSVERIFFSCNEIDAAHIKLKRCEDFSDVQTSALEDIYRAKKRPYKPNKKYISTSSSEVESNDEVFQRPPTILKPNCSAKVTNVDSPASSSTYLSETLNVQHESTVPLFSLNTVPANTKSQSQVDSVHLSALNNNLHTESKNTSNSQILFQITKMREEIKEILGIIRQSNNSSAILPSNLPTEFSLKIYEDFQLIEDYLKTRDNQNALSAFLATLGGDTTTTKTNKILKYVLTNQLAKDFNFIGQKNTNKKAFSKFELKNVIIRAVQIKLPFSTTVEIEKAIKIWLKHAPERYKTDLKEKN